MKIREIVGRDSGENGGDSPTGLTIPGFRKAPRTDPENDERIQTLMNDPRALDDSDDAEIKRLYRIIKEESYAEETRKKRFGKIGRRVGKMIRADKKRTEFRHIRKYGKSLAISGLLIAVVFLVSKRYIPKTYPTSLGELGPFLSRHIGNIREYMPEVELGLQIFTVGLIMYIVAKTVIMIQDRRLKRRIVCKAVTEGLDVNEVVRLSVYARKRSIYDIADFYPLKELCKEKGR